MRFLGQFSWVEVVVFKQGHPIASDTCELSPRYIKLSMGSNIIGSSLSHCPLGKYEVKIAPQTAGYSAVLSRGNEFEVVSEFASVPRMKSAIFSDDFTSLIISFDVCPH